MYLEDHYPFEWKPLKFSNQALEPYLDERTLYFHHQHYKNYVEKLNDTLRNYPELHNFNLEELISNVALMPEDIKDDIWVNAGGVYNHQLYFDTITPNPKPLALSKLKLALEQNFETISEFIKTFKRKVLNFIGVGYIWLSSDFVGNLKIVSTTIQDTTIHDNLFPLLCIDLWEHSYYLKYANDIEAYFDAWSNLIDWEKVSNNYTECLKYINDIN